MGTTWATCGTGECIVGNTHTCSSRSTDNTSCLTSAVRVRTPYLVDWVTSIDTGSWCGAGPEAYATRRYAVVVKRTCRSNGAPEIRWVFLKDTWIDGWWCAETIGTGEGACWAVGIGLTCGWDTD